MRTKAQREQADADQVEVLEEVHAIRAWSCVPEDEAPMCGAKSWRRTIYHEAVTCPGCLAVLTRGNR